MSNKIKLPNLPFLTREMLKWGSTAQLELVFMAAADSANPITMRGITRSGIIEAEMTTLATGVKVSQTIGIDDIPIMVSVIDQEGSFNQSECWASITLRINGSDALHLASGFVSQDTGITWPATQSVPIVPGHGLLTTVTSADPAANTEILITVPNGEIWLINYFTVSFVTDANAANRRPSFLFTGPSGETVRCWSENVQAEGSTRYYYGALWGSIRSSSNLEFLPVELPSKLWLGPEGTITTDTSLIQAGDNYGTMKVHIEKFFGRS